MIPQYIARIDSLLPRLDRHNLALATQIASLPLQVRGFGHVKLANLALARAREAELLHRLDPVTWPRPAGVPQAGQFRGITVAAERV